MFPIAFGVTPSRSLFPIRIFERPLQFPTNSGILPLNLFCVRTRTVFDSSQPMIIPTTSPELSSTGNSHFTIIFSPVSHFSPHSLNRTSVPIQCISINSSIPPIAPLPSTHQHAMTTRSQHGIFTLNVPFNLHTLITHFQFIPNTYK
ncbi:hypothetical protein MANES_09G023251v8 [Manihot esculenta]|uniref:Uncharacterized protein n=1 Tax=Manihot esculenta TaxID=3983 RepID=A0ACB7H2J3_MANES|nr:hypothetical protein MANES_09G023251v8 [Manihot esculenta]